MDTFKQKLAFDQQDVKVKAKVTSYEILHLYESLHLFIYFISQRNVIFQEFYIITTGSCLRFSTHEFLCMLSLGFYETVGVFPCGRFFFHTKASHNTQYKSRDTVDHILLNSIHSPVWACNPKVKHLSVSVKKRKNSDNRNEIAFPSSCFKNMI